MSLRVDDRSSRGRSSSTTRERERSRSNVRAPRQPSPPRAADYAAPVRAPVAPRSAMPGTYGNEYDDDEVTSSVREVRPSSYDPRSASGIGSERPGHFRQGSQSQQSYPPATNMPYPQQDAAFMNENYWKDFPPHERPGYNGPPPARYPQSAPEEDHHLAYGAVHSPTNSRQNSYSSSQYPPREGYSPTSSRQNSYSNQYPTRTQQAPYQPQAPRDPYRPQPPGDPYHPQGPSEPHHPQASATAGYQYGHPTNTTTTTSTSGSRSSYGYHYAEPPEKITYTAKPQGSTTSSSGARYAETPQGQFQVPRTYAHNAYDRESHLTEVVPSGQPRPTRERTTSTSKSTRYETHQSSGGGHEAPSARLSTGMGLLSVGGGVGGHSEGHVGGGMPPPSPLLEAYHGTYQSISPLPMAIRPPDDDDDELNGLSDLEPLSPTVSRASSSGKTKDRLALEAEKKKRVKLYDPEKDASVMADALKHSKVNSTAICDVLPGLTHDEIMYLRKEYKKQVKVQGKGVNLPKHMKTKLTGNFGKVAYVTALGRWESEGYWANFFYQSHGSRRELLIESLMGRTNAEIKNIEEEFKDKRYGDSLKKCMEKELKMDKFRVAVLMVLRQERQEEQEVSSRDAVEQDVYALHQALTTKQGGESKMLEIIILSSDAHLREVLKMYERSYQENFPRAALKKSNNLVGEVIAHILNGVINRPARDALLLHHAIEDIASKNKDEELRYELLISRLVRLHWDKMHLLRVKKEYATRYKNTLEDDIEEATRGDFGDFLVELCEVKIPGKTRE